MYLDKSYPIMIEMVFLYKSARMRKSFHGHVGRFLLRYKVLNFENIAKLKTHPRYILCTLQGKNLGHEFAAKYRFNFFHRDHFTFSNLYWYFTNKKLLTSACAWNESWVKCWGNPSSEKLIHAFTGKPILTKSLNNFGKKVWQWCYGWMVI